MNFICMNVSDEPLPGTAEIQADFLFSIFLSMSNEGHHTS